MNRNDSSIFLLYIEPPKEEKHQPIEDGLTKLVELALQEAKTGSANYSDTEDVPVFTNDRWRGGHTTDCGECSTNMDYQLCNGMITNSLAPFYVRHYRNSIPKSDWAKLYALYEFYCLSFEFPNY